MRVRVCVSQISEQIRNPSSIDTMPLSDVALDRLVAGFRFLVQRGALVWKDSALGLIRVDTRSEFYQAHESRFASSLKVMPLSRLARSAEVQSVAGDLVRSTNGDVQGN